MKRGTHLSYILIFFSCVYNRNVQVTHRISPIHNRGSTVHMITVFVLIMISDFLHLRGSFLIETCQDGHVPSEVFVTNVVLTSERPRSIHIFLQIWVGISGEGLFNEKCFFTLFAGNCIIFRCLILNMFYVLE